jgi:hypothetical protein
LFCSYKTKENLDSDVNISTKINKTKERLHSYVNISINMNKTKESLNSDGQQFLQYQQNKREFKQ